MRIVSLCPSTTETVFALGRGADLVGITKFCVHPRPGVDAIERLGGTKNPEIGRILALAPDMVLMNREENRVEDAEALAAAGLRVHASLPRSVSEVATELRVLGSLLDARSAAQDLAERIEQRARLVQLGARARPNVRVAYLIWRRPWMAAGSPTYIDDLLRHAGGSNLFGSREARYPTIEPSELRGADVVLLSSEPFPFQIRHARELSELSGLPEGQFRYVDGESFSWHGARTLAGLDHAERALDLPWLEPG